MSKSENQQEATASVRTNFGDVLDAERERIRKRRTKAGVDAGIPEADAAGFAISGGGIRSATFNLGLLQAMQRYGIFRHIDYMSTVSGGGYIGSSLSWFMSSNGRDFPFGSQRKDYKQSGEILAWLREHGEYLTPGSGVDGWSLATAILRGILVNLLIFLPFLFSLFYLLSYPVIIDLPWPWSNEWDISSGHNFDIFLFIGLLLLTFWLLLCAASLFKCAKWPKFSGWLLKSGVIMVAIGIFPHISTMVLFLILPQSGWSEFGWLSPSISIPGIISFLAGLIGRTASNEMKTVRRLLFSIGIIIIIYGLLLLAFWMTPFLLTLDWWQSWYVTAGFILPLCLGILVNINNISIHRYYRDRLAEAYMPDMDADGHVAPMQNGDNSNCLLHDLPQTEAPYHIINTNMVTVGSKRTKLRIRGGENFIFSPCFSGSESTAYVGTSSYLGGKMDLATAFAISGAAVDPNTGTAHSRPLAFLMALLNLRLGYWVRNPAKPPERMGNWSRPYWHVYLICEMFGKMDESMWHVRLSDGGHFENLGLYELIRRKCRYIIVSDAGADPDWTFGDLAKAIEMVRVDFGTKIEINTQPLHPEGESRISQRPFVTGKITYADESEGQLLYIKTSVVAGLPEDIYSYQRTNDSFPDQTTTDQFFDEAQFEAYRELGYQIGHCAFADKGFEQIFHES